MNSNAKKNMHSAATQKGSSLSLRILLPTVLIITIIYLAVSLIGQKVGEELYNRQTIETLNNNLQLAQRALNEGWQNTQGAALRTEGLLREYTSTVLAGRLDFIGFSEQSGVMIFDSYTGKLIQAYPNNDAHLLESDIRNILKETSSQFYVYPLQSGGHALSTYFAPLGLHLIAFNKVSYQQTAGKKSQEILLITVFALTTAMLIITMFAVIYLSITKPLMSMQKKMAYMMKEDQYNNPLNTQEGSYEVQELSKQFNTLISHLHARDQQIQKHTETLEKKVEERTAELKNAQGQLILTERLAAIGEFASSVAHELRNPLSSIKLGVEKISEIEHIEGTNKRRLTLIQKEVARLSEMLSGILSFAAPSPVDIQTLATDTAVQEAIDLSKDMAEMAERKIIYHAEPGNWLAKADSHKLKQILLNVLKNAFEGSPNGSTIDIELKQTPTNVMICIQNEGEHMPKEVMDRLFEPFFTTKSQGTGLGLATTKRLLQEMGGDITLENHNENHILNTITLQKAGEH